jgi:hypothetical protein
MIAERDLHPGPVIERSRVYLGDQRDLALGFEEVQEQTKRGRILAAAKHPRVDRGLGYLRRLRLRSGRHDRQFFAHSSSWTDAPLERG